MKVLRNKQERTLNVTVDQLDLDAEQQSQRATRSEANPAPETQQGGGFGLTLGNVTPQISRRQQLPSGRTGALVTEVDPDGPSAGLLRAGDIILSVNRKPVASAGDAARELQAIGVGPHRADSHLARRRRGVRHRQEGIATDLLPYIRERGPLTVAAFMELALYHPETGYYARAAQRSGRAGDFFTSVDVGPVFGELLEVQFAEMAGIARSGRPGTGVRRSRRSGGRQRPAVGRHPAGRATPRPGVLRTHPPPPRRGQPCRARRPARGAPAMGDRLVSSSRRAAGVLRRHPVRQRAARRAAGSPGRDAPRRPARDLRRRLVRVAARRRGPAVDARARGVPRSARA